MDSGILSFLQDDRGWLFWSGAAAVAAGASLLLAAGVWHALRAARRLRTSLAPRGAAGWAGRETAADYGDQAWRKTAPAPAQREPEPAARAPQPAGTGAEPAPVRTEGLAVVLRRLRGAADQLEEMAERSPAGRRPDAESDLKAMGCDVEYVFRASGP